MKNPALKRRCNNSELSSANMTSYPLEQIVLIKQKKADEAEKVLAEKKALWIKEQEKLLAMEKERDLVKEHRLSKLNQLREQMDEGAPSTKIQQMRSYLKVVDEKLKVHEGRVLTQKKATAAAEAAVDTARQELLQRQHDVEKMRMHKQEWEKEQYAIELQKENLESDEMGAMLHHRRKKKRTPD